MNMLDGQVAIVFGASRGIGKHTAIELANQGAAVVLAARRIEECELLAAELTSQGHRAIGVKVDVTDYHSVTEVVEQAVEVLGSLQIVINNAGIIQPIGTVGEVEPDAWARCIETNLIGTYNGCRAALPYLLQHKHATIVNVSSGAASNPMEGWSAYCAGKAAVAMLTRSLHLEYGTQGLCAYGFRPGLVDTDMQAAIRESGINDISRIPKSSLLPPAEPARAIAWLCTQDAAMLSGGEVDIRDPEFRERARLR